MNRVRSLNKQYTQQGSFPIADKLILEGNIKEDTLRSSGGQVDEHTDMKESK